MTCSDNHHKPVERRFSTYIQFPSELNEAQAGQTLIWLRETMAGVLDINRFDHVHITVTHQNQEHDCDC